VKLPSRVAVTAVTLTVAAVTAVAGCGSGSGSGSGAKKPAAAVGANDTVALLWPSSAPGDYALIVDGVAEIQGTAPHSLRVVIRPAKAVLHVTSRVAA